MTNPHDMLVDPMPPRLSRPQAGQVLICANPFSGSGANRRHVDKLIRELAARGLTAHLVWGLDERRQLLADTGRIKTWRCVVCAGGDGSINSIINEMAADRDVAPNHPPLAVVPVGTENLFARHLGFTMDMDRLVAAIAAGRYRCMDLGVANGRLFTLMVTAGFDAHIVHRMAAWRAATPPHAAHEERSDEGAGIAPSPILRRINRWSYARHILAGLREYRYPRVSIEVDGSAYAGSHVFVFNLPRYAANLGICRRASCDDQMLDWILLERPGWLSLMRYLWAVVRAKHLNRPDVRSGRASKLRILAGDCDNPVHPLAIQIDGDPAGFTPVEIEVRPRALRVIDTT